MLKKIGLGIVALIAIFAIVVASRPSHYKVARSTLVLAPSSAVYARVADFHGWDKWSPWEKLDPGMQKVFSGADGAPGAAYAWKGNDKVGEGRMTLLEARPAEALDIRLEFVKPFASVCATGFRFAPQGSGTQVTWTMEGDNDFLGKAFSLFLDMDKMIGGDFERGLGSLKALAEADRPAAASR
ncbi:MAG TPA: SRPBCC family protein [Myxococcales bacterium]